MKKKTNDSGITLIALIITIIVILILVAVTVNIAVNSGLFSYAKKATGEWTSEEQKEINLGSNIDQILEQWVNGNVTMIDNNRKYEVLTTDDGMWEIYKDIDTTTTKVNVYVASKYYYPSFEQFVLEQYYLQGFLYVFAVPAYEFSDITDFYVGYMERAGLGEMIEKTEIIKNREETMGIGITFEDILKMENLKDYEVYKELGAHVMENANKIVGLEETQASGCFFSYINYRDEMPELAIEKLREEYDKLYGEKIKMNIQENEKNKSYEIQLPDGNVEKINGENLNNAKFRYITTKNEEISIKISDGTTEKTVNYTAVNNIGNCIYKDDEYIYTYNCFPFMGNMTISVDINKNMKYRMNLGRMECSRKTNL